MDDLDSQISASTKERQEEVLNLRQDNSALKLNLADTSEKYVEMKADHRLLQQDLERWQAKYNSMRDQYLRLDRDKQRAEEQWEKHREEREYIKAMECEGDSYQLIEKQRRDNLKEKNAELVDAIIKQERLSERYKWELKKTGEALEEEAQRVERLRRENAEMKKFI